MFANKHHTYVRIEGRSFDQKVNSSHLRMRVWPVELMFAILLLVLVLRLCSLTLVEGAARRVMADANRIVVLPLMSNRGAILDRQGMVLTQNIPVYRRQLPNTNPLAFQFEDISREQALTYSLSPDARISYTIKRTYPCHEACAPVVGYVSEITADQLANDEGYRGGDLVGIVGAEKAYENRLRGKSGEEYVEVTAQGKIIRAIGNQDAVTGSDVYLSIDAALQQYIYSMLNKRKGAVVVMEPTTGEIISLVSSPSFDPGELKAALVDENQPLFNRATRGLYPPGSTFKLVTALAGLESRVIDRTSQFTDTGVLTVGDYSYGNWLYEEHGRTEGEIDLVRAIARSNDIFFYRLGGLAGPDVIAEMATRLGIGRTFALSEYGEIPAVVPTPEWKQQNRHEGWFLGNTYHMAIGQGDVLATPLSIAVMTAAIANNGVLCPPKLIKDNGSNHTTCEQLSIRSESLELVQMGMKQACESGGTGSPFFSANLSVACKTGTAQQGGEKELPHAWFTAYGPIGKPEYAVTVLLEKAGQGSTEAAPIAKEIFEYLLK